MLNWHEKNASQYVTKQNISSNKARKPVLCIVNLGTLQMIHLSIHSAAQPSALLLKKKKVN